MTTKTITPSDLAHYYGSETRHKSNMFTGQRLVHTDGVQYVAENGGAYWLLDLVASHFRSVAQWTVNCGGFATITLRKNKTGDRSKVVMGTGNGTEKTLQMIHTDFPYEAFDGKEFKMYIQWDGSRLTLMLPSEY